MNKLIFMFALFIVLLFATSCKVPNTTMKNTITLNKDIDKVQLELYSANVVKYGDPLIFEVKTQPLKDVGIGINPNGGVWYSYDNTTDKTGYTIITLPFNSRMYKYPKENIGVVKVFDSTKGSQGEIKPIIAEATFSFPLK